MLLISSLCSGMGCRDEGRSPAPDPLDTVHELLRLHGLKGKQPEQRSADQRNKVIEPRVLAPLFTDYGSRDRFIDDLYVGFVTGALARFQGDLGVLTRGDRAEVIAGEARVVLKLRGDRFRIDLEESIPEEIKRRARDQKKQFERAQTKR